MHFTIQREALLKPLQLVAGVVERKQTMPVLSNVLLVIEGQNLSMTGTDTEVELVGRITLEEPAQAGEITVPARKLMDICKNLPADAMIDFKVDDQKVLIKAGRSRFTLTTLPASDFPSSEEAPGSLTLSLKQGYLRHLIERTSFAMAQQDVRYYLNGLLLEAQQGLLRAVAKDSHCSSSEAPQGYLTFSLKLGYLRHLIQRTSFAMAQQDVRYYLNGLLLEAQQGLLRAVATDGHRLALCSVSAPIEESIKHQVIVPRKGVLELARLMNDDNADVNVVFGSNYIRATTAEFTFISKLVDGKFPDYERVLPRGGDKTVIADRQNLREELNRASILSNEIYRGIRWQLESGLLKLQANNPEQEVAEDEVTVDYSGDEIGRASCRG